MENEFKFYFLWLSLICIIVFVLQQIPDFTDLFILNSKTIVDFQIWRFLTAIFLHSSIVHLSYNLFALLFFGGLLEKTIGSKNFLVLFICSGIIANMISVNFYSSSLGASGAIYGILGVLIILKPTMVVWAFGLIMPMFVAGILWIIGGIIGIFIPGNTGHIAHLSGIGIGILVGLVLITKKSPKEKIILEIPEKYFRIWEEKNIKN